MLKKEWKIVGTWTMNGNIFVKKTEQTNRVMIKCKNDLDKL